MVAACIPSSWTEKNATNFQGSTGFGFPPHIIKVKIREDGASKVLSCTQNCTRDVCILSTDGVLSNASLIQAEMSGGAVTFEGQFEILSLSGSFLLSEIGGQRRRTGGLNVSLAGSDGRKEGANQTPANRINRSTGSGIIPHIIKVKTGEDVSSKILSFTHYWPRAVCISSATGELSSVLVLQADTSRGVATYEGLFNILTLSGSFLPSENGDQRNRTRGFSVSFTGSKRRIFGGAVAGALIAASPVEVSVFSFGPAAGLMNLKSVGQTGASTAPSRGMYSGLLSELSSHPKSKRSGSRKQ